MEMTMKLEAGDVLVKVSGGKDWKSVIERWALGYPYDHVFLYMGQMQLVVSGVLLTHPMLFESNGRGVVLQSLSNRYGQKVVVMRLKSGHDRLRISYILEEAIKLASDSQSHYDYQCIVKYILPRLIAQKLGLPLPLKYHRDAFMVCSEAVFEVFVRGGLPDVLLAYLMPPLPGDFVTASLLLEEVGRGVLSLEWV